MYVQQVTGSSLHGNLATVLTFNTKQGRIKYCCVTLDMVKILSWKEQWFDSTPMLFFAILQKSSLAVKRPVL